jgi:hypothetical protein
MKLPDFVFDEKLNALRAAMGASLGDFKPAQSEKTLSPEEIEKLATEGIEIPLEQVEVLNDGSFVYKGRRVIVYIRDVAEYGSRTKERELPRFHLAVCETLTRMMDEGRYKKRYVVSTRDDGFFQIQRIRNDLIKKSDEHLSVCQHCLHELNYSGFTRFLSSPVKRRRVNEFSIQTFFEAYGRSCVWATPKFDSENAPPNVYGINFHRIAKGIKEQRGYRCENTACGVNLSAPHHQKFLHAHHIDADKSDNRPSNIQLLCIRCHANSFQHSHLRESPHYSEFNRMFSEGKSSRQR